MGAGVSVASDVLDAEAARPLDASDVDTPRGESAKQEVARLRLLLAAHLGAPPRAASDCAASDCAASDCAAESVEAQAVGGADMAPGLQTYLASVFRAADVDASGVLSAGEFWQLLQGSELGLTPEQVASLQTQTQTQAQGSDCGEQGDVTWMAFVALAPQLLANLMGASDGNGEPEGGAAAPADDASDWCALSAADGAVYYYNKRTQASAWEPPASWATPPQ